jgi:hypothetical protein
MTKFKNLKRCEACTQWIRALKATMFCDECLKLNSIL